MELFQNILRNYGIITRCLEEENEDFLRLQISDLIEHFSLISNFLDNNCLQVDERLLLQTVRDTLYCQVVRCEEFLKKTNEDVMGISMPVIYEGQRGRPKYDIPIELVNFFINNGVSFSEISRTLNVSRRAFFSFRQKNAESIVKHRIIDNNELTQKVLDAKKEHPEAGYRYVWGYLKSRNIFVSWQRLRQCVQDIDPVGVYNRRRKPLKRRVYRVKAANYLWHMDGNEKLVHWNFYIHGCTDGYSRKVVYLQVAPTKKAALVLGIFEKGVEENGLPVRVRADRGTENFQVMDYMHLNRPEIKDSFIFGKSVHNVRIERMWREVNRIVGSKYRMIFKQLEEDDELDQRSYLDLLCLCYVFLPRIQRSLDSFKATWNHHGLRTVNSKSPNQLWVDSLLRLNYEKDIISLKLLPEHLPVNSSHLDCIPPNFDLDSSNFEIDPNIICHFNNIAHEVVHNPLSEDNNEGKNLYKTLRNIVLAVGQNGT